MKSKTKTALLSICLMLLLVTCTIDGEVAEDHKNKLMKCTDTRDGETFYYNTNTIHDVRIGIIGMPHKFKIVTIKGDTMQLHSDMEAWLKITKVESN